MPPVSASLGDNLLHEQQKEISRLQRQVVIARDTVDELNSKIRVIEKQGFKLANSLGFNSVYAAQASIDVPYTELGERIVGLQADLLRERKENENLRAQLQELRAEKDAIQVKVGGPDTSAVLSALNATHSFSPQSDNDAQKQLRILRRRYDELEAVKLRAEERHRDDYRKFHKLCAYMKSRDIRDMEDDLQADYPKLTKAERRTRRAEIAALIEKKIDELDAEKDGKRQDTKNHSKATVSRFDKENQQTPVPDTHHASVPLLRSAGTVFLPSSKMPPALEPASIVNMKPIDIPAKQDFSALNNGEVLIPNSSDTEEDSDPAFQPLASLKISPVAVTAHPGDKTANSSDTEPDSQDPFPLVEAATPAHALPLQLKSQADNPSATTPKPAVHQVESRPQNRVRHSDGGAGAHLLVTQYADEERPRKMRRLSSAGPSDHISVDEPGFSAATSLYVNSGETPRRKQNRDRTVGASGLVKTVAKDLGKGIPNETPIKMETPPPITNMHASSSRQLADYSAYKGRGRYANDGFGGNTGINAQFGIDPAQNAGKDFQFDDVVRKRQDRRRLEAGDCECCSNYYDAIGPMPNRLHAPLWRSPPSSSGEGKRCLRTRSTETDGAAEIMSHKQAISRHRHRWARATTPPSYWNIGFPSTQEVVSINDKAREMHQHKQILVQEEADLDGSRYHKKL